MTSPATVYRVLARTYRPSRLSELVGQDALVRTLSQAFATGRLAHAFLFAGMRGVGKTTVARILARGLNCTGPDGQGGPTPEPCGVCSNCRAIAEERSLDVIETDAASHTGKDDIQEIIEGIQYAPAEARFKVYIFDEVHMLSEKAWNSLLKTVEEPPPHVKFIFATTEVRKVPLTVLSRCQRFDLRRVDAATLAGHLERVCRREDIAFEPRALSLIARAAEGSVRDALSLLDQAVLAGDGAVRAAEVERMLGLADRGRLFDLFERVIRGDMEGALEALGVLWERGAEPEALVRDLLDAVHGLTRLKLRAEAGLELVLGEELLARARALAAACDHPRLQRLWQMLLKGLGEVQTAPDPLAALEMLFVRLCCVSDLPPPGELARMLREEGGAAPVRRPQPPAPGAAVSAGEAPAVPKNAPQAGPQPASWDGPRAVYEALRAAAKWPLAAWFYRGARVARLEPGRIELALAEGVPRGFVGELKAALEELSGRRWVIVLAQSEASARTLSEEDEAARLRRIAEVAQEEVVQKALALFPGARVVDIRRREPQMEADGKPRRSEPA